MQSVVGLARALDSTLGTASARSSASPNGSHITKTKTSSQKSNGSFEVSVFKSKHFPVKHFNRVESDWIPESQPFAGESPFWGSNDIGVRHGSPNEFSELEEATPVWDEQIGLDDNECRQLIGVRDLMDLETRASVLSIFCIATEKKLV
jgi:hypothetical protein